MVFCLLVFLVVSTSAIDCLERLISKMTRYVFSEKLNPTQIVTGVSLQGCSRQLQFEMLQFCIM